MIINDGGPAFPIPIAGCNDGGVYNTMEQSQGAYGGMTLRDYFAAKAMQSVIADLLEAGLAPAHTANIGRIGPASYAIADAMLAARTNEG